MQEDLGSPRAQPLIAGAPASAQPLPFSEWEGRSGSPLGWHLWSRCELLQGCETEVQPFSYLKIKNRHGPSHAKLVEDSSLFGLHMSLLILQEPPRTHCPRAAFRGRVGPASLCLKGEPGVRACSAVWLLIAARPAHCWPRPGGALTGAEPLLG